MEQDFLETMGAGSIFFKPEIVELDRVITKFNPESLKNLSGVLGLDIDEYSSIMGIIDVLDSEISRTRDALDLYKKLLEIRSDEKIPGELGGIAALLSMRYALPVDMAKFAIIRHHDFEDIESLKNWFDFYSKFADEDSAKQLELFQIPENLRDLFTLCESRKLVSSMLKGDKRTRANLEGENMQSFDRDDARGWRDFCLESDLEIGFPEMGITLSEKSMEKSLERLAEINEDMEKLRPWFEEYKRKLNTRADIEERILRSQKYPSDYAHELAERFGQKHFDVILGYLRKIEDHLETAKNPGAVSKDPPLEITLDDGTKVKLYAKVLDSLTARRVARANNWIRKLDHILESRWTEIIGIPYERDGESVVLYVDAGNTSPLNKINDEISDKLMVLAHLHTKSKSLLKNPLLNFVLTAIKSKSSYEVREILKGITDLSREDLANVVSIYESVYNFLQESQDEFTVIHGDFHRENIINGMIIDQESLAIGHPYLDVACVLYDVDEKNNAINELERKDKFRAYLNISRALENPKSTQLNDGEFDKEWKKLELIAKGYEAAWRIARVGNYSHLRDLPYRISQRELLTEIIKEYMISRNQERRMI